MSAAVGPPGVSELAARSGLVDVSRETMARLQVYVDLLLTWQRRLNLIGRSTEAEVWDRHIVDSLQLVRLAPPTGIWLDLGSGAGLPGLVVAICTGRPVILVESDGRKCAFLREAVRVTGAQVEVRHMRIEALTGKGRQPPVDVISARAVAPLPRLFGMVAPLFGPGTVGLFHKGARWAEELTAAGESWIVEATPEGSLTHPDSVVLRVTSLAPREAAASPTRPRRGRKHDGRAKGGRHPGAGA